MVNLWWLDASRLNRGGQRLRCSGSPARECEAALVQVGPGVGGDAGNGGSRGGWRWLGKEGERHEKKEKQRGEVDEGERRETRRGVLATVGRCGEGGWFGGSRSRRLW